MILVGLCSGGDIKALTVNSMMEALGQLQVPNALSIQIGGYKPHAMNNLVEDAKQIKASHLLNIDCDMLFQPDAISKLLRADKDIVGVNYRRRGNHLTQDAPESTVRFPGNEANGYRTVLEADFPKQLFECAAVGLGLTLINMRLFKGSNALPFPYFRTIEDDNGHQTEDMVFCNDARALGFEVWCDPTIMMKHLGEYLY